MAYQQINSNWAVVGTATATKRKFVFRANQGDIQYASPASGGETVADTDDIDLATKEDGRIEVTLAATGDKLMMRTFTQVGNPEDGEMVSVE